MVNQLWFSALLQAAIHMSWFVTKLPKIKLAKVNMQVGKTPSLHLFHITADAMLLDHIKP